MDIKQVFIVEDSELIARNLEDIVKSYGYSCAGTADNGPDAIEQVATKRPDLVLMDIWLKGDWNGIETAKRIHNDLEIPIIFLTASSDIELIKEANISFGSSYLIKPIDGTELFFNMELAIKQNEANRQIQSAKRWRDAILDGIIDGVVAEDSEGRIIFMNGPAKTLLEVEEEKDAFILKQLITILRSDSDIEVQYDQLLRKNECRIVTKSGKIYDVIMKLEPIELQKGGLIGNVVTFTNITDEKRMNERIRYLTFHDSLTGLYNRNFLDEEIHRLDVERQLPMSIIMADLNGLKLVNDICGHVEGDRILKLCAEVLKESCRDEDLVARIGGDEFLIILPKTTEPDVLKIINRIQMTSHLIMTQFGPLGIAIGHHTKSSLSESIHDGISKADEHMYRNKALMKQHFYKDLFEFLKHAVKVHSYEGADVSSRMAALFEAISLEDETLRSQLASAMTLAEIHDVGMLFLEDSFHKGDLYSESHKDAMRRHSDIGAKIAIASELDQAVIEAIQCHHERWDGRGYPNHLKGEEIPYLARMLSILDSYIAMTYKRHYRPLMTEKEAQAEIAKGAGNQFDPYCVNLFFNAIESNGKLQN